MKLCSSLCNSLSAPLAETVMSYDIVQQALMVVLFFGRFALSATESVFATESHVLRDTPLAQSPKRAHQKPLLLAALHQLQPLWRRHCFWAQTLWEWQGFHHVKDTIKATLLRMEWCGMLIDQNTMHRNAPINPDQETVHVPEARGITSTWTQQWHKSCQNQLSWFSSHWVCGKWWFLQRWIFLGRSFKIGILEAHHGEERGKQRAIRKNRKLVEIIQIVALVHGNSPTNLDLSNCADPVVKLCCPAHTSQSCCKPSPVFASWPSCACSCWDTSLKISQVWCHRAGPGRTGPDRAYSSLRKCWCPRRGCQSQRRRKRTSPAGPGMTGIPQGGTKFFRKIR